jgi:trehalose 6-phosphate phosphatase
VVGVWVGVFVVVVGWVVGFAERPDAIGLDPGLASLLQRLRRRLSGRLVIVSGRALADLDRYLGDAAALAAGAHGAEIRGAAPLEVDPAPKRALARARLGLARDADGLLLEDKGAAIALHYRERPELGALARQLAARLADESSGALIAQPGHMVVELVPAGVDKGGVVRAFLNEPAFAGRRPVFAGDDVTDEAGFRAAAAAGGYGVLVGESRPSAATYALPDVAAVHRWLASLVGGLAA